MKESMLLKKICSIYANDLHFATMIFPFIHKEIEENTTIRTILEKNEEENIDKILKNVGLNSEKKEEIKKIDWRNTNINKIRKNFKLLEEDIINKKRIDIIVSGRNIFIEKVNQAIDLWIKNNIEKLEKTNIELKIINCFYFEENKNSDNIIDQHDYILRTSGLEEILGRELLKAN